MRPYNVEFFDRDFNFLHNDLVATVDVDDDYLAVSTNSITINQTDLIVKYGFVYISGNHNFFGVVTDVSDDEHTTTVSFKSVLSLFDQNVIFDTSLQNGTTTTLERAISDVITQYWINSGDILQSLSILKTETLTDTSKWDFGISVDDSDKEKGITKTIVNLYNDILVPALTKYGVAITPVFSITKKQLILQIGTSSASQYVEADLPTVKIEEFQINQASSNINKLEIWNSMNYTEKINYYYHTDNTYSTKNENRVTPVVLEVLATSPNVPESDDANTAEADKHWKLLANEGSNFTLDKRRLVRYGADEKYYYKKLEAGTYTANNATFGDPYKTANKHVDGYYSYKTESGTKVEEDVVDNYSTFDEEASNSAFGEFAGRTWTNLIELTVGLDDSLIEPINLKFGQEVKVIHNGSVYSSILTGKKFSTTMTLTFGTVRLDLTKKLKMGG